MTEEEHPQNQNATGATVSRTMTLRNPANNTQVVPANTRSLQDEPIPEVI